MMKTTTVLFLAIISRIVDGQIQPFIIGGDVASIGIAPYHVSLRTSSGFPTCGGAIIGDRWIITAAHCLSIENPIYVIVGTNKLYSGGIRYDVLLKIKHTWYKPDNLRNDIGLIKTKTEIVFTDLVKPIMLPWNDVQENEILILTGHGRTNITSGPSPDLKIAYLKSISNEECKSRNPNSKFFYSSTLCTLTEAGACYGDSGSPLVKNGYIYGISSYSNSACDKRYPEGYTRVHHFKLWIYLTKLFNIFS